MEQKFRRLASDFLGEERVNQIIELAMNLEKLADLRELTVELSAHRK